MTNKRLLVIGQFTLLLNFVGFWTNYLYFDNLIIYFFVGVLIGLSLLFNLVYLIKIGNKSIVIIDLIKKAAHNKRYS